MKRLLLGLLNFQFFTFAAHAQIEKGSIMLGGKINYNNSNSNSDANYEDFSTFSDGKMNQFTRQKGSIMYFKAPSLQL